MLASNVTDDTGIVILYVLSFAMVNKVFRKQFDQIPQKWVDLLSIADCLTPPTLPCGVWPWAPISPFLAYSGSHSDNFMLTSSWDWVPCLLPLALLQVPVSVPPYLFLQLACPPPATPSGTLQQAEVALHFLTACQPHSHRAHQRTFFNETAIRPNNTATVFSDTAMPCWK